MLLTLSCIIFVKTSVVITKRTDHDRLLVYLCLILLPIAIITAANINHNEYVDGSGGIYNLSNTVYTHRH
jgi:hypothetical protein